VLHVVKQVLSSHALPHLLVLDPFVWDGDLHARVLPTKIVGWVLGVPISDTETCYLREHGFSALGNPFE
jgi:hypothetical protein